MSINVTVSGNPINIRRGRMVLSDLDQIKKNERERRRRLRLEQVRQQSKEISHRLLERAKNIAKEELNRLERDGQSELKRIHERKIMEIQRKYQEDMEDIGQAHEAAALQPNVDLILEEERRKNRLAAIKRGKEAMQQLTEAEKPEDLLAAKQDRIRQIREIENLRSSLVAKLPKKSQDQESKDSNSDSLLEDTQNETIKKMTPRKKKGRKSPKKTPSKLVKTNVKVIGNGQKIKSALQFTPKQKRKNRSPKHGSSATRITTVADVHEIPRNLEEEADEIECMEEEEESNQAPRKSVPVSCGSACKADKIARYNPEDYTGTANGSSSSTSASDDSSYFSDSGEQPTNCRVSKPVSATSSKVHLYDHSTRQRNTYDRPVGTVERVDVRNEPSAMDQAERMERSESVKAQLIESRRINAQRRGDDAILRERVRRDYQTLMDNLDHLAKEERKLKASQTQTKHGENLHLRGDQRKEHQAKMDRAFREIFNKTSPKESQVPAERVITLPPREAEERKDPQPCGTWQEPPFRDSRIQAKENVEAEDEAEELSREEQILEMLKKVERQKRLLLQEFGADLPSDIFNASLKSLLEKGSSLLPTERPQQRPKSPEIKVINLSSCDEKTEKRRSSATKKKTVGSKRKRGSMAEIAVQTSGLEKSTDAKDKSVQVELRPERIDSSDSVDQSSEIPHPLEPKVTVITPPVEESTSGSSTSIVTDLVIDIDRNEVKVSPRKKSTTLTHSKISQKSRSMPSSKASSPVKKGSKSLPGSRMPSPRKGKYLTSTPSRTINIQVSRNGFNVKVDPSQSTKVAVDASTESAEILMSEDRPYRIQSHSRRSIRIRDTSEDTSTSFASPPPARPGSMIGQPLAGTTPILELLDSSANESTRFSRKDVSPVSTPETPSPRTMMMPSNVPHPERIGRVLRYETNENDSTLPSSTLNDRTTSTEQSDSQQQDSRQEENCTCKNPECRLMHARIEDAEDHTLRACPEILKKYEDLQNMCSERIASLTDLIEKVRSDQRGLELSVMSSRDETRLMDLPPIRPVRDDLQTVRRLVESIETIHNQLARTLLESQRIITNESGERETPTTTTGTVTTETNTETRQERQKPRIISEERVNVQLNRFKMQQKPQTMLMTTPEKSSWPLSRIPVRDEDVISKLSREILEQSREKTNASGLGKDNSFSSMKKKGSPSKDEDDSSKSLERNKEKVAEDSSQETKKIDFVPILAGIPKVPRYLPTSTINGRGKPPVTLLSGPYRTELEGPVHELSTIIEFDTPDTGNRSQGTSRSPGGKSKDPFPGNTMGIGSPKDTGFAKPSIHVAPLPVQENRRSLTPQEVEDRSKSSGEKVEQNLDREIPQLEFSTKEKLTSTSSNSFSGLSGVSEITTTPSSEFLKYASSPEEMETALKKLGLGWAIATLKKTREASALSSSSNSDLTPINTARKLLSPVKKAEGNGLPDLSDVSSISMKEASKSTERVVLMKGRTSTPNLQDSRSNSSQCTTSNSSGSLSIVVSKKSEDL